MQGSETLKQDTLGTVRKREDGTVERDTSSALPGQGWIARRLARREAAALDALNGMDGVPRLIGFDGIRLRRSYLPGDPLHHAAFDARVYFRNAFALLRRLHARGIAHNDLAKEANWICMKDNGAGIVDFQLAMIAPHRGLRFRRAAREDLRHLLKHKRHYRPELLTERERAILATPLIGARMWRACFKPVYHFITRRVLGWIERDGAEERQWR